jgi:hypothetical protein
MKYETKDLPFVKYYKFLDLFRSAKEKNSNVDRNELWRKFWFQEGIMGQPWGEKGLHPKIEVENGIISL